jgi:hypothetical protein
VQLEAGQRQSRRNLLFKAPGFAHRGYRGVSPPVTSVSLSPCRLNRRLLLRREIAGDTPKRSTRPKLTRP